MQASDSSDPLLRSGGKEDTVGGYGTTLTDVTFIPAESVTWCCCLPGRSGPYIRFNDEDYLWPADAIGKDKIVADPAAGEVTGERALPAITEGEALSSGGSTSVGMTSWTESVRRVHWNDRSYILKMLWVNGTEVPPDKLADVTFEYGMNKTAGREVGHVPFQGIHRMVVDDEALLSGALEEELDAGPTGAAGDGADRNKIAAVFWMQPDYGATLESQISSVAKTKIRFFRIARTILKSLDRGCHQNNIFHNDLKPANISATGVVYDFGNGLRCEDGVSKIESDKRLGASFYAAPETFVQDDGGGSDTKGGVSAVEGAAAAAGSSDAKKAQYSRQSDYYSLGIILLELLAGQTCGGYRVVEIEKFRTPDKRLKMADYRAEALRNAVARFNLRGADAHEFTSAFNAFFDGLLAAEARGRPRDAAAFEALLATCEAAAPAFHMVDPHRVIDGNVGRMSY